MKKLLLLVCFTPFLMATQCNEDDQVNCTQEARAGINITVKDRNTQAVLTEGVTVQALDGSYVETLEDVTGSGVFSGAWERQGNYVVTVSKQGYEFHALNMTVRADVCHVIPINHTVELIPQ